MHIIRSRLLEIAPLTPSTSFLDRSVSLPAECADASEPGCACVTQRSRFVCGHLSVEGASLRPSLPALAAPPTMFRALTSPGEMYGDGLGVGVRVTGKEARKLEAFPVEPQYAGPRLTWPLTQQQVVDMMSRFNVRIAAGCCGDAGAPYDLLITLLFLAVSLRVFCRRKAKCSISNTSCKCWRNSEDMSA